MHITTRGFVRLTRGALATMVIVTMLATGFVGLTMPATADAVTTTLYTSGHGTYNQWSGDFTDVDEISDFSCSSNDYIRDDDDNNDKESFTVNLLGIPNGSLITSIDVLSYSRDDDDDDDNGKYRALIRFNGTNSVSSDISPSSDSGCSGPNTKTFNVPDTVKSGATTLEIGVEKANSSGKVRVGAVHAVVTYTVPDTTAPTVTINQAIGQTDPTGSSPITFTAVFSEPVSDFDDAIDVIVSGTANPTTASISGGPSTYTVQVSGMTNDGTVIATIPAGSAEDLSGNDNLASTATDNQVTYELPNQTPTANNQSVETDEDVPVNITLTASDPDSDPLSWIIVMGPDHGDLTGTAPNLTYTPDEDYNGSDDFQFQVNDGEANSNVATVDIDIDPVSETCPNGFQLIEGDICVPILVDPPQGPDQCVIVSDTTDFYVEDNHNAVLTFVHTAWADLVVGASWIWGDALVVDPSVNETQTFTKTFYLAEVPTNADIEVGADNAATVVVNGITVLTQNLADQNYNDTVESVDVTAQLVAGPNTLEITVINEGYATQDPQVNPAGLIYRLVVDGSACGEPEADLPENSCIDPNSVGAPEAAIPMGTTPGGEDTLQTILDTEYLGDAPNATSTQDNFQEWTGTGNTVTFTAKNISKDTNSAHTHVFGYHLNGGAFTPIFKEGTVGIPHDTAPNLAYGASMSFSIANVNSLVFAIGDWDGSNYDYYATDRDLNAGTEDHALVYNVDDDLYALAFEDLSFATGDEDYNDVVVSLHVDECESGTICEPGLELLTNGTFEVPEVPDASKWDIFNIVANTNLGWAATWLNPTGAPTIANVELQEAGLGGWLAAAPGDQWTELDSDWGGPSSSRTGDAGQVAISQTIDTVPGETYTLDFDFSPRPETPAAQNKVEVLQNGELVGSVGPLATAGNQTEWTSHSFSFVATSSQLSTTITFRDAGTLNDSLGTFVDNASVMCQEPEPTATLVATKIVCNDELDLPNWGDGDENITATTASDFLASHVGCHLEPDWQFQWVTDAATSTNPGDNIVSPAPSPWYLFGPTAGDGTITTSIPAGGKVWVREVLKDGYIPFTGQNTDQDVSAEIYCSTDVLNYDNWDWIDPVDEDTTYYCVAFNAPTEPVQSCEVTHVLLSSDSDEGGLETDDQSGPASLVGEFIHAAWADTIDALWIWKDTGTDPLDAANGTSETFTRTFEIVGTPLDSTLDLAVDNSYEVKVNGTTVCADAGEHNYEATTTCAVPASVMQNGPNTITFEVTNMDHASANDPENNPAGLLYKLTVNENECEIPPQPFSSVTMCKRDVQEDGPTNMLPNWTVMLQGDPVETLNVTVNDSAGSDTVTSLEDGLSYIAMASGLWRNAGQGQNWVDAEYSTTDGWVTPFDGFLGYSSDILELQINSTFDPSNDWGPYNNSHVYAQSFIQPVDGSANFRVYDGHPVPTVQTSWYGDNVDSTLAVDLYKGYAGVTGEDGCVTFNNVPYGQYTAAELLQEGWVHYATWDGDGVIDGTTVVVNEPNEFFTIQNRDTSDNGEGDDDTGTLVIVKETTGGDGTFNFDIGGNGELNEEVSITTGDEDGNSESIELEPGLYSITENVPEGWTLTNVSCEYEESEGIDEGNGYQIVIEEGETVTCTFENELTSQGPQSFDTGGTGPNINMGGDGDGDGDVLGAQTGGECGPLLETFLRMGGSNDSNEVLDLQGFLNEHMSSGLPLTGLFGPMTDAAVRAFQLLYWQEVLQPWFGIPGSEIQDADDATGYVYKTTQRHINNIFCPSLNLPMPELP